MTARIITIQGQTVDALRNVLCDEYRLESVGPIIVLGQDMDETRIIGVTAMDPEEALRVSDALRQFARARGAMA